MQVESFRSVSDDILDIVEDEPKGYWEDMGAAPILSKQKYDEYPKGEVPIDETCALDLNMYYSKGIPLHMLVVGKSGRQKTRIVKNVLKAMHKLGYNILIFEPKEFEMKRANKIGKGVRLAKYDKNEKLPVVSYTPAAYHDYLVRLGNREYLKNTKFYSLDIRQLDYKEIWMSFGMPSKGAQHIVSCLNKGITSIDKLKIELNNMKAMGNTKIVSIGVLNNLEGIDVFNSKFKPLPLKEEWEKGNIVVINYHGRMGDYMNTDIGFIISLAKNIGQEESIVSKKMIVFDDAFMYAGAMAYNFSQSKLNYAQIEIGNCQYNYRIFGIDTIIIVQNLDSASIMPTFVEGRTEFLITQTGSSEMLRTLIPSKAYFLAVNKDDTRGRVLYSDRKNWYYEWIYCNDDGDIFVGFPFDVTVGHG